MPPVSRIACSVTMNHCTGSTSRNRAPHANNGCTSCHTDITNIEKHRDGKEKPAPVDCGSCHQDVAKEYRQNFHYLQEDFRCSDCHSNIHAIRKDDRKNVKLAIIEKCTECHGNADYAGLRPRRGGSEGQPGRGQLRRLPRPAQHPGVPHLARAIPGRGPRVLHPEMQALPRRQRHDEAQRPLRQNGGLLRIHLPRKGPGIGLPRPGCRLRRLSHPSQHPSKG